MATYFAATFTVGYAACVFLLTSFTCGNSAGDAPEKCDVRTWYLAKIGEGLFPQEMTTEQQTIKSTIESTIQKSSTNANLAAVDCSVLKTYESVFKPDLDISDEDAKEEVGDDAGTEGDDEEENEEVDETEMSDDDTEMGENGATEETDEDTDSDENSVDVVHERTRGVKPAFQILSRKCRKQKSNRTSTSCVFVNTVTYRCILSDTGMENKPKDFTKEKGGDGEKLDKSSHEIDGRNIKADEGAVKAETKETVNDLDVADTADGNNVKKEDNTLSGDERKPENQQDISKSDDFDVKIKTSKSIENDRTHNRENREKSSDNKIDLTRFKEMLEKTATEYMMKIQSLETQIMRLENELLIEKLNKQNHTSSFSRLENQILKLENELLKMNLSYEELKEENEKMIKKQKSFLELDYVKRPGDYRGLPDNSTKQFELISQHQDKISELTDHLRNQSKLIDKIRGQSDSLEGQNRMLFQIVMNQTMLISQMMKKVEALSDSNLKHQMQQQMLTDKLGVALASGPAMDDLHAMVSDKLSITKEKESIAEHKIWKNPQTTPRLSLSKCRHPKRNRAFCGFNSIILSKCLWDQNFSTGVDVPTLSNRQVVENGTDKLPEDTKPNSDTPHETPEAHLPKDTVTSKGDGVENDQKTKKDVTEEKTAQSGTINKGKKDPTPGKRNKPPKNEVKKAASKSSGDKRKREASAVNDPKQKEKDDKPTQKPTKTESKQQKKSEKTEDTGDMKKEATKNQKQVEPKAEKQDIAKKPQGIKAKKTKTETKPQKSDSKKGQPTAKKPKADATKAKAKRIPPLYNVTRQIEPKDCADYYRRGKQRDGLFKVKLHGNKDLTSVFCDMKNGGWTVIQRRQDGTVNFFRTWDEYKQGFGGVFGEHWLGNDIIHRLTNQDQYELRVDLMDWEKNKKFAEYSYARVDSEEAGYMLHIEGYSGNAGDGLSKHNGEKFSTKDRDNDRVVKEFDGSCANRFKGAWWYYKCYASNLNGRFYKYGKIPEKLFDGITWKPWTGPNISLRKVEIKVRPIGTGS